MTGKNENCRCKRGEPCECKSGLHDVFCANCDIYLCSAPAGTASRCYECGRWTKLEPEREDESFKEYAKAVARVNNNV